MRISHCQTTCRRGDGLRSGRRIISIERVAREYKRDRVHFLTFSYTLPEHGIR